MYSIISNYEASSQNVGELTVPPQAEPEGPNEPNQLLT
jgi:hypothetical protein